MSEFMNLFSERMNFILGNRKKHPWGKALGLSHGLVARLFEGELPASEKLIPISRAENVSLTWLIEGSGEPYMVHHTFTEEETAELLSLYIDDENWEILVLKNPAYPAIVLTQPATMMVGKKHIDYTAIEIIAGPMGEHTLQVLANTACSTSEISPDDFMMRKLYAGKMSKQELFGDNGPCVLKDLMPFNGQLAVSYKVAEAPVNYNVDKKLLQIAIEESETVCIEENMTLNPEEKSKLIAAVYKYMLRTHSIVISNETLLAILDAL